VAWPKGDNAHSWRQIHFSYRRNPCTILGWASVQVLFEELVVYVSGKTFWGQAQGFISKANYNA